MGAGVLDGIGSTDAFSSDELRTMQAVGAMVELVASPEGITPTLFPRMTERAAEIVEETGAFATDQPRNHDMLAGHGEPGRELPEQLNGRLVDSGLEYLARDLYA